MGPIVAISEKACVAIRTLEAWERHSIMALRETMVSMAREMTGRQIRKDNGMQRVKKIETFLAWRRFAKV